MSSSPQSSRSSHSTPFTTYVLDDQDTYLNHSDDDPTNAIELDSYVERKLVRMAPSAGLSLSSAPSRATEAFEAQILHSL
jgi:hypothetical protein